MTEVGRCEKRIGKDGNHGKQERMSHGVSVELPLRLVLNGNAA